MKSLLVFFALTFTSIEGMSQNYDSTLNEVQKNYYRFSDSIIREIDRAIIKIDSISGKNNVNYFLVMSTLENETIFMVNHCTECPISKLIQSSNRYTRVKSGKLEVPIIFGYDLKYSNLLEDESGHRIKPNIGGYGFSVGRNSRITSKGFQ